MEVLQEQIEKQKATAFDENGLDNATCTITKEMVEAKMREKTQKQN